MKYVSLNDELTISDYSRISGLSRPTIYEKMKNDTLGLDLTLRNAARSYVKSNDLYFLSLFDLVYLIKSKDELNAYIKDKKKFIQYPLLIQILRFVLECHFNKLDHTVNEINQLIYNKILSILMGLKDMYGSLELETDTILLSCFKYDYEKYINQNVIQKENITFSDLIDIVSHMNTNDSVSMHTKITLLFDIFRFLYKYDSNIKNVPDKCLILINEIISTIIEIYVMNVRLDEV